MARFNCKNCTEDIFSFHTVLFRCVECQEDLDLCPECFASAAQLGDHLPTHEYRVIDNANFPVLDSDWAAKEHIDLLDSVEQYGYGNWEDISKKVSGSSIHTDGNRDPVEARDEFSNSFIVGAIGRASWREDQRGRVRDHTQGNPLLPPPPSQQPLPNISVDESIMLGYQGQRDDFEIEFDNEAEELVSSLQGGIAALPDEEDIDQCLKIAHVDMYKFKLRERERRKKVAREHQLITQFFKENPLSVDRRSSMTVSLQKGLSKKKESNKGDLTERLKVLAEFQGVVEHQQFMSSIIKEREIKTRIRDLTRYRRNGITRLKDSTDYEVERLRRNRRRNEMRRMKPEPGSEGSPMPIKYEDFNNMGVASPLNTSLSPSKSVNDDKFQSIAGLPGYEVLSNNEKRLCVNLRLSPAHYTSYKTCLLTHHLQKKKGQTPKPLNPVGLDKNNRKIIFQFLMRAGWITAY